MCWHCDIGTVTYRTICVTCTECEHTARWVCGNPKCKFYGIVPIITTSERLKENPNYYEDYLKTAKRYLTKGGI